MVTVCNLFIACATTALLVGHVSYGHKLHGILSDEDERASCPNTNCDGKGPCTSSSQCPSNQCCIDMQMSKACCYTPGDPTRPPVAPPATATIQSPTSLPQDFPSCDDYTTMATVCPCTCTKQSDCYSDEVCCVEIITANNADPTNLRCYKANPQPPPPIQPWEKCPYREPPLDCNPEFDPTVSCNNAGMSTCPTGQTCCLVSREGPSCCVTL